MPTAVEVDLATLDSFVAEMLDSDREAASTLVASALDDQASLEAVVTGLFSPALLEAGRRWAAAEIGVSESVAAATLIRGALWRAEPSSTPSGHPSVVVCCPEGEAHDLAAEMLAEVLGSHGWPARMLGAGMPARDLRIFLRRRGPAALMVTCTTPAGLPEAAEIVQAATEAGVPTVVAGAGFGADDARATRLGAAAWAHSVPAAVSVLDAWRTAPPRLVAPGVLNDDYPHFATALPEIRAAAMATLRRSKFRRRDDAVDFAGARDGLDLLLGYFDAALLVDDQRVLLDYLTWMTAYSPDEEASAYRLNSLLQAVAGEIPAMSPRAARFIDDAVSHLDWTSRGRLIPRPRLVPSNPAGSAEVAPPASTNGSDKQQGQVFADLLFLAAVSCHAPMALISVVQPDGHWSTLSYGVDRREALNEPALFAAVAAGAGPMEVTDLAADPSRNTSALFHGPLAVRFVYGHPLRTGLDSTLGVFCVMDRRARQLTGPEHQAMSAIARQVTDQIVLWRRTTAPRPEPIQAANRRRSSDRAGGTRPGPDAALVDLLGLRRPASGVEQHLLRSHEVAVLFDVTERTVINWAASRKLPSLRTAGGHLRFRSDDVVALLAGRTTPSSVPS